MMGNLRKTDPAVFDSIISEARRQADGLELIASENFVSEAVLEAMDRARLLEHPYFRIRVVEQAIGFHRLIPMLAGLKLFRDVAQFAL